jgi:hypothetical protein
VFTADIGLLGWLPYDLEVTRSLWRYRPIARDAVKSRIARGLQDLTGTLSGLIGVDGRVSTGTGEAAEDGHPPVDQDGGDQARAA